MASFWIGRVGGFLGHARLEAAALDHETGDHAVKHGVVVVALVHVRQEVGGRQRRFFSVEFNGDDAMVGNVQFDFWVGHVYFSSVALRMVIGVVGTFWCMPWLPTGTDLILSTTSMPAITLPNTVYP